MRKKGFTLVEMMVVIAIVALLSIVVTDVFFSGTRAYRKEIENFTILDSGRFLFIRMRDDIRNCNSIDYPPDDGEEHDTLTLIKHKVDFSKDPKTTPDFEGAPVYFENKKIEYTLEGYTDDDDKKKYKDLKKLVRTVYKKTDSGYEEEEKDILSNNVKELVFTRRTLKGGRILPDLIPEEVGSSPSNVKVNLILKSYRKEDYNLDIGDSGFDPEKGYEVAFSTFLTARGAFLGGDYE